MMKKLLVVLLTLLPLMAQAQPTTQEVYPLVSLYDLDSTSYIYCAAVGERSQVLSEGRGQVTQNPRIKTSGSSTTVVSNTASSGAFTLVAVGDVLVISYSTPQGTTAQPSLMYRTVTARANANSITVNAALDLTNGAGWLFRDHTCGTAATSGWVPSRLLQSSAWTLQIDQMNATSIDAKIECQTLGPNPTSNVVWSANYTAAAVTTVVLSQPWEQCRLGYKVNTDDGGDTGADAEQITVTLTVWR